MDYRYGEICFNIYTSDKILENIFQYFDLKQQLELVKVTKRFEYVLKKKVWPKTYNNINLYKNPYITAIRINPVYTSNEREFEANDPMGIREILNGVQCQEFVNINAKNINKLKLISEFYIPVQNLNTIFTRIQNFQNLKELTYYRLILNNVYLELIVKSCKILNKLHLLKCFNNRLESLIPGQDFSVDIFKNLRHLEELIVESEGPNEMVIKSLDLQKMFMNLNLKTLIFKNFIIYENSQGIKAINNSIEVLDVGLISLRFWPKFVLYLKHFENLLELSIKVIDCNIVFDDEIIKILSEKCCKLEKLSLGNYDLKVKDFILLKNLKYLILNSCGGLTFANLQQILGGLKLKSFALIKTRIYGVTSHIYISPTLEELSIDSILFKEISNIFQNSLNRFENLHTLLWFSGDITDNWILDKCPKLSKLHIPNPYSIFQIKTLKELTFTSCSGLSWAFILSLITNWSLEKLCFRTHDLMQDKLIPQNGSSMKTTLLMITMPYNIFQSAQAFWQDLKYSNKKLEYVIEGKYEDILRGEFLKQMVYNDTFCKNVKFLKIRGFKIGKL